MRKPLAALIGSLLVAAALPGRAQTAAGTPPRPGARPAASASFDFEDPGLPQIVKQTLEKEYGKRLRFWPMLQPIVQALVAQRSSPRPMEQVLEIDAAWQRGENPQGLATELAENRCAQELKKALSGAENPAAYREAFVTDDRGVLVCMTDRTSDYFQGDEAQWSRAFAGGAGAVFVSKAERDASTSADLVHISLPVRSAGQVVGVLIVGWMPPSG